MPRLRGIIGRIVVPLLPRFGKDFLIARQEKRLPRLPFKTAGYQLPPPPPDPLFSSSDSD